MAVKPIPDGYRSVTPYLVVDGGSEAIEFYKQVFDATELMRLPGPGGKIMHAEIRIGDSMVMLADEFPDMNIHGPHSIGGSPVGICLYVENADETFNRAVESGANVERPIADQFYGDRTGTVIDPFGHKWTVCTHIEDVTPEEIQKRMGEMASE